MHSSVFWIRSFFETLLLSSFHILLFLLLSVILHFLFSGTSWTILSQLLCHSVVNLTTWVFHLHLKLIVYTGSFIAFPVFVTYTHQSSQKMWVPSFTPLFSHQLKRHRHGHDPSSSSLTSELTLELVSQPQFFPTSSFPKSHLLLSLPTLWFF